MEFDQTTIVQHHPILNHLVQPKKSQIKMGASVTTLFWQLYFIIEVFTLKSPIPKTLA